MARYSILLTSCLAGWIASHGLAGPIPTAEFPVDKGVSSWLAFNDDATLLAYRVNVDGNESRIRIWKLKDGTHYDIAIDIAKSDSQFPLDCRFAFEKDELVFGQGNLLEVIDARNKLARKHATNFPLGRAKKQHHTVDKAGEPSTYWSQLILDKSRLTVSSVVKRDNQWKATLKGEADFSGSRISSSCVSRDGRSLIVGTITEKGDSAKYALTVWDLQANKKLYDREAHDDWVDVLAISDDGKRFVSGGADGRLIVWDTAKGSVLCSTMQEFSISSVTILSRAELVVFSTREREGTGNLKVLDMRDKKVVAAKRIGDNGLKFAAVSSDKKRLATLGYDPVVQVWDVGVLFPALAKRFQTE